MHLVEPVVSVNLSIIAFCCLVPSYQSRSLVPCYSALQNAYQTCLALCDKEQGFAQNVKQIKRPPKKKTRYRKCQISTLQDLISNLMFPSKKIITTLPSVYHILWIIYVAFISTGEHYRACYWIFSSFLMKNKPVDVSPLKKGKKNSSWNRCF